ncbi:hypothetical protein TrLO_g12583 [Triparma laevis f. longispina]|uniref:Uncharacterized protein n=1 Tax=Triparma laevis f. longispina TaxID=1714387 RepID=A0A9W7F968_9STRA|nr:hypothetical protein TrLO_g12583 [Triparma laevis f. longispina]
MFTNDFKGLLGGFVQGDTLMTMRLATKTWKRVADAFIDERGVRSGELIVRGSRDMALPTDDQQERLVAHLRSKQNQS